MVGRERKKEKSEGKNVNKKSKLAVEALTRLFSKPLGDASSAAFAAPSVLSRAVFRSLASRGKRERERERKRVHRRGTERPGRRRRRRTSDARSPIESIDMAPKRKADNLQQKSPAEFFAENKNIAGFDNVRAMGKRRRTRREKERQK